MPDVLLNIGGILSYRIHIVPAALKFVIAVFERYLAKLLVYHQSNLPLKIPINLKTLIFDGISSGI